MVAPAAPVRAHSYRRKEFEREWLPPLQKRFDPILVALGPDLDPDRRKRATRCVVELLKEHHPVRTPLLVQELRALLREVMPKDGWAAMEELLGELGGEDPVHRGMVALALIVDAALPLRARDMSVPLNKKPRPLGFAWDIVIRLVGERHGW